MSSRAASKPAAAKRSITSPASTASPMTCLTAASMSRDLPPPADGSASSASRLRIIAAIRWKNARCGVMSFVSSRGTANANAIESRFTIPRNRFQPVSSPTFCPTSST